jgi:hypothetical protein
MQPGEKSPSSPASSVVLEPAPWSLTGAASRDAVVAARAEARADLEIRSLAAVVANRGIRSFRVTQRVVETVVLAGCGRNSHCSRSARLTNLSLAVYVRQGGVRRGDKHTRTGLDA